MSTYLQKGIKKNYLYILNKYFLSAHSQELLLNIKWQYNFYFQLDSHVSKNLKNQQWLTCLHFSQEASFPERHVSFRKLIS